jgi:hypothetical protein
MTIRDFPDSKIHYTFSHRNHDTKITFRLLNSKKTKLKQPNIMTGGAVTGTGGAVTGTGGAVCKGATPSVEQ